MRSQTVIGVVVVLALGYLIWSWPKIQAQAMQIRTYHYYSQFVADLHDGKIASVILDSDSHAHGDLTASATGEKRYTVDVPPDPALADKLRAIAPGVRIAVQGVGVGDRVASMLTPLILLALMFFLVWWFINRQMRASGNQALTFARSQAKLVGEGWDKVTFDEVAGMDEVKQELREIVDFLRSREKYRALGAKVPRGVLLIGPPGCGKTLLARAVAGEAQVAFFYLSGSDFVEMFVGVGASRVRDLFNQAKTHLPAIVFIDELDAVGRVRGAGIGGGHDEREQTLNALLVEMDGFDPNANVIVMAATNRPDILDPALLRPGRFDRRIVVHNPDVREREAILKVHTRNKPLQPEVDLNIIARRTPGFSGADLESLCNEGALLAARENRTTISMKDMEEARERVISGPERRSHVISDKERRIVAYHEAGHALVGTDLPGAPPVDKVTILPRAMALGYTSTMPEEDRYMMQRSELLDRVTQMLGGRAAEELVFHDVTTGAANDLEQVTDLARRMVTEFGMSEALGPVQYGKKHGPIFLARELNEERNYSEDVAQLIDSEVRVIVDNSYEQAREIVERRRPGLDALADALLEFETLDAAAVKSLIATGAMPPGVPTPLPGGTAVVDCEATDAASCPTPSPLPSLQPPLPEPGA
jgi:cell division protease FtsH